MDYKTYKENIFAQMSDGSNLDKDKKLFTQLDIVANREKTELENIKLANDIEFAKIKAINADAKDEAEIAEINARSEKTKAETEAVKAEQAEAKKTHKWQRIKIGCELGFAGIGTLGAIVVPVVLNAMTGVMHRDSELRFDDGEEWTIKQIMSNSLNTLRDIAKRK